MAGRRVAVDAIIVPASRPVDGLREAIALAKDSRALLVVICSRAGSAEQAARMCGGRGIVIDVSGGWSHPLLDLSTGCSRDAAWGVRGSDLHVKRNIALLLARLAGWRRVFFLDDDVRGVQAARLQRAAALLNGYAAVGFRVADFPDNSVARHAHRLAGGSQDVFISGGALAVDCSAPLGFFPAIYGDDWFFLFGALAGRRVASAGQVSQLAYDPFDPDRAAREEFGDLVAEGVLESMLERGTLDPPPVTHWTAALAAREGFLRDVGARLQGHRRAQASVLAALARLRRIEPSACAHFVGAWHADLDRWQERLASLPGPFAPSEAASWLGLTTTTGKPISPAARARCV